MRQLLQEGREVVWSEGRSRVGVAAVMSDVADRWTDGRRPTATLFETVFTPMNRLDWRVVGRAFD